MIINILIKRLLIIVIKIPILINKLNIINDEDLFNAEREFVFLRTYELK